MVDREWNEIPFQENQNPFYFVRLGKIIEVLNDREELEAGETSSLRKLGTVRVEWFDLGGTFQDVVPIIYPSFSNPIISENLDDPSKSVGSSYGFLYMPSVGDVIVCGFRQGGYPIVLGYLPKNFERQTVTDEKYPVWGTFRLLKSGEYCLKSERQAEIYFDWKGNLRGIVRTQVSSNAVPSEILGTITLGTVYTDEALTTKKVSAEGKDVNFEVKMKSGATIQIDIDGNVEVTPAPGKQIILNSGTKGVARKDDGVQVFVPPSTFLTPAMVPNPPMYLTGDITGGSDQVKSG